jgi:hypothetical protein
MGTQRLSTTRWLFKVLMIVIIFILNNLQVKNPFLEITRFRIAISKPHVTV